jgi:type IV pilus assembly protein PilB
VGPRDEKKPKQLGERLLEAGLVTKAQLSLAESDLRRNGGMLENILEKLGFVSQADISKIFAGDLHTEYLNIGKTFIDPEVLKLVPLEFAKQYQVIPLNREGYNLTVAMADTFDVTAIDALEKMTGLRVEVVATSSQSLLDAIENKYVQINTIDNLIDTILQSTSKTLSENSGSEKPVVHLVDQIISNAVRKRATDIHIEPDETAVRIRLRIDGVLHQEFLLPKALQTVVVSRLKIMGKLDITEHRLPQDGRIVFLLGKKQVDLRMSSLPTQFGESIVLRVLDKTNVVLDLKSLGIAQRELTIFEEVITKPHGIVLVTGPTGSGKTTTLYAALSQMDKRHQSIFTLEDPIEYSLPMIRQTQINAEIGMSFAGGLRALLRQDPDIILVGEIRDEETAQLGIRAALTGHLVLSTLHTNSAASAIPRLINMGIEPYLLNSTLNAVVAQRLVRRICPDCAEPSPEAERLVKRYKIKTQPGDIFKRGKGCEKCFGRGYLGRIALYEIMHIDYLRNLPIHLGINDSAIIEAAVANGMKTMLDDGTDKARAGICSIEDITQVTG